MLQVRQPKHFYMQLHASVCDLKHSTWFDDDLWREPGQQRLSDPMIFDSRRNVTCLCWNIHFQMQHFSLSQTIRNTVKTHQDKAVICGLCLCCLARLNNWCLLRILLCFFLQLSDQSFFFFFFLHLCCSWLASTELEGKSQHLDCHLSHSGTQEIKPP